VHDTRKRASNHQLYDEQDERSKTKTF